MTKLSSVLIIKPVIRKPKPKKVKLIGNNIDVIPIIDTDGTYKAYLKIANDEFTLLPFTDKSFELKGREIVFSKERDEHNHYVRYYRNKRDCVHFGGNKDYLIPFAPSWVIRGNIIKIDGKRYFDFVSLVCPKENYSKSMTISDFNENEY